MLKMNSQTKPVKIRIKSGGEEHASLNSLKNNFHVLDVCDLLDNRLSRWLRQQNQHELANELDVLFPAASFEINDETIASLLRLFFCHDIPSTTFGLLDFAKYWHEHNDMVNFMNLLRSNLTIAKYYYYNDKKLLKDNEWELLFNKYKNSDQDVDNILIKIANEIENTIRKTSPKERFENIIKQYKSTKQIIEIDYKNPREVELVDFLYKCRNIKNLLTGWEDKVYEHATKKQQLERMKELSNRYSNEWNIIRSLTYSFMQFGKVNVSSIVAKGKYSNFSNFIGCSEHLKDYIDEIVNSLKQ